MDSTQFFQPLYNALALQRATSEAKYKVGQNNALMNLNQQRLGMEQQRLNMLGRQNALENQQQQSQLEQIAAFRNAAGTLENTPEGHAQLQRKFPMLYKQSGLSSMLPEQPKLLTGNYVDEAGNYNVYSADPNSGDVRQLALGKSRKPTPAASVTVDVGGKGMSKLAEEMSKSLVARRPDVVDAANGLQTIAQAENLLDAGVITGTGAEFLLNAGKALQRIGVRVDDDEIANTEAYTALMGKEVGSLIRMFGSGTGLSDADRQYAERIAAGKITINERSLRKILNMNKKARTNLIRRYNREANQAMSRPGAEQLPYDLVVPFEQQAAQQETQPAVQRREAPPQAVEYLRQNPHLADAFQEKYGYLPEGF